MIRIVRAVIIVVVIIPMTIGTKWTPTKKPHSLDHDGKIEQEKKHTDTDRLCMYSCCSSSRGGGGDGTTSSSSDASDGDLFVVIVVVIVLVDVPVVVVVVVVVVAVEQQVSQSVCLSTKTAMRVSPITIGEPQQNGRFRPLSISPTIPKAHNPYWYKNGDDDYYPCCI